MIQQILRGPNHLSPKDTNFTWVSGRADPIAMPTAPSSSNNNGHPLPTNMQVDFTASSLPHTKLSEFIQKKVRELVTRLEPEVQGASETVSVREISCCNQSVNPSETINENFEDAPAQADYRSRSIMLFQKIDNTDIAIFSMYVQEYDADSSGPQRIYLAYLDSVEFFRPRAIRSNVYHEIVVSYFADAKRRGFEKVHIWSCPPTRGNNFIFWGHPSNQKTPNRLRLQNWYQCLVARAMEAGIVTNCTSLYDEAFEDVGGATAFVDDRLPKCPPVLAGDFWVDEASRITKQLQKRNIKSGLGIGSGSRVKSSQIIDDKGVDLACMLKTKIMNHPSANVFLAPVDVQRLKLHDYFTVVKKPMDLGTVCANLGKSKYATLSDCLMDLYLVFDNAMLYNPPGHPVHAAAGSTRKMFDRELALLCKKWQHQMVGRGVVLGPKVDFLNASLKREVQTIIKAEAKKPASSRPASPAAAAAATSAAPSSSASTAGTTTTTGTELANPSGSNNKLALMQKMKERSMVGEKHNSMEKRVAMLLRGALSDGMENLNLGHGVNSMNGSSTFMASENRDGKEAEELGINCGSDANAIRAALIGQFMMGSDFSLTKGKRGGGKKDAGAPTSVVVAQEKGPKVDAKSNKAWLKIEVAKSIRRMRQDFFVLNLKSIGSLSGDAGDLQKHFEKTFNDYIDNDPGDKEVIEFQNPLVSHRHCFLELSQKKHFQFSSLRLAKYSSTMLLYYLHRPNANSLRPRCCNCQKAIRKTRWHCSKDLAEINLCCDCYTAIGPQSSSQFTPFRCTGFADLDDSLLNE